MQDVALSDLDKNDLFNAIDKSALEGISGRASADAVRISTIDNYQVMLLMR